MNVIFNVPPKEYNPTKKNAFDFLKGKPGIYIYGIKTLVDGTDQFIPLYVGTAKDLYQRVFQHYTEESTGGNSKKELFRLDNLNSVDNIKSLYKDMAEYDRYKGLHLNRFKLTNLIWFNNKKYFNYKINKILSTYVSDSGQMRSINNGGDLDIIESIENNLIASNLKNEIINTKKIIKEQYHFLYAELEQICSTSNKGYSLFEECSTYLGNRDYKKSGESIAKRVEIATKNALKKLNINTTAKADGLMIPMNINLQSAQDLLINMEQHNFGIPFIKPLIINL